MATIFPSAISLLGTERTEKLVGLVITSLEIKVKKWNRNA